MALHGKVSLSLYTHRWEQESDLCRTDKANLGACLGPFSPGSRMSLLGPLLWGICAVVLIWLRKMSRASLDLDSILESSDSLMMRTKTTWVPGVTALPPASGVEAGPFQFRGRPCRGSAGRRASMAGLCPPLPLLCLGPCFPQTYNCSKGLGSEAERAVLRPGPRGRVKLNSCRQAEEVGEWKMELLWRDCQAPSPPPHKPSI